VPFELFLGPAKSCAEIWKFFTGVYIQRCTDTSDPVLGGDNGTPQKPEPRSLQTECNIGCCSLKLFQSKFISCVTTV